jgi:hypothetical protein
MATQQSTVTGAVRPVSEFAGFYAPGPVILDRDDLDAILSRIPAAAIYANVTDPDPNSFVMTHHVSSLNVLQELFGDEFPRPFMLISDNPRVTLNVSPVVGVALTADGDNAAAPFQRIRDVLQASQRRVGPIVRIKPWLLLGVPLACLWLVVPPTNPMTRWLLWILTAEVVFLFLANFVWAPGAMSKVFLVGKAQRVWTAEEKRKFLGRVAVATLTAFLTYLVVIGIRS